MFDNDEGWLFDPRPITHAGNEAVNAEIMVEDSSGVFTGQVDPKDISESAHGYGFWVAPGRSLVICVRLRASSLACTMAGMLSISQFTSPNSTNSEDRWGAINSHMAFRAQLGAEGGL
jgi:hypothetical protein